MSSRIVTTGLGLVLFAMSALSACKLKKVAPSPAIDSVAVSQETAAVPNRNTAKPEIAPPVVAKDSTAVSESSALLSIARGIDPEVGNTMLEQGKTIYQTACVKCHAFKDAKKYTPEHWEKVLTRMAPKARLTEEQARSLRVYTLAYQKQ